MTQPFNLGNFQEILDIYGADIQRWPDDVREKAETFLKKSEDAQSLYLQAMKIDHAINPKAKSSAPEGLLDKIINSLE